MRCYEIGNFLRDFGGHIAATLGVVIAVVSLLYSQRALRLAEMQADITMSIPLSLSIDRDCIAKIDVWPEWAVLQSLEFWPSSDEVDPQASIRQRTGDIQLQLLASGHAARWHGHLVPSRQTVNIPEVLISFGEGSDSRCTPASLAVSNAIPVLAVYDVEVASAVRRTYKLMALQLQYVYYPTSVIEHSSTPYYVCESIVPVASFASRHEAFEALDAEIRSMLSARASVLVDGQIPSPQRDR